MKGRSEALCYVAQPVASGPLPRTGRAIEFFPTLFPVLDDGLLALVKRLIICLMRDVSQSGM